MKKIITSFFAVMMLVFLVIFSSGCGMNIPPGNIDQSVPTISVRGEGRVEAIADEAIVRFGVVSDDKTLTKAYADNSLKMNAVIEMLKKRGIASRDITTSSYTVTPVYPRDESGRQVPGKPSSFRVSQELTVRVRNIENTGEIIDDVISGGVNIFSGIQFISSRMDALETEARIASAKDAARKASVLAEALGVKLGRILRVSQTSDLPYPVARMMAQEVSMLRSSPQIEPGTMEVTAVCEAVYEILQ